MINEHPIVSVIIPAYNHRDYIKETINSVLKQTYKNIEIIVINDGSPDDTEEVIKPFIESFQIKYYRKLNEGVAASRNYGIKIANGKFICFLDDDDLVPEDKLEWQVEFLNSKPEYGMISGNAVIIDKYGKHLDKTSEKGEISFKMFFSKSYLLSPGQALFRRETIININGFNQNMWGTDDWDLYLRISRNAKVFISEKPSLYYRKHNSNASGRMDLMLENSCKVLKNNIHFIDKKEKRETEKQCYRYIYAYAGTRLKDTIYKTDLKKDFKKLIRSLGSLSHLIYPIILDPKLFYWVFKDYILNPVWNLIFCRIK